ncbi:MAG: tRNA 2-thiocytidine(32) synthetase TtcA [Candidatus Omnitrophica bacterium]|nr:tRNA 2-thiocytidine(32) synthetase TtcA [Candidatus Omnitrophota bacterium]
MARSKIKQKEKFLRKKIGMAIRDYGMIQKGDRICVAVSGGKDSLTLLKILSSKTLKLALGFTLRAVHIVTDYRCSSCTHTDVLKKLFEEWGVEYHFGKATVLKNSRSDKVSCFWCSWNKRKAIFEIAEKFNCNKVAFGHHKDDIIETVLLNLLFNGEISTMNAGQEMFKGKFTIIRPLCYTEEKETASYAKEAGFSNKICRCPNAETSKRKFIKDFIKEATKISSGIKSNLFHAPSRIREDYLGRTAKDLRRENERV